jgi:hypothetical protein
VSAPTPEEIRRASKAFGLGAVLGLVMRLLARRREPN